MAEQADWAFPPEMRPRPEDWRFDLDAALDSVVQLRAEIPEDAFTAPILGTERGKTASCRNGENVVVAGHGGREHELKDTVFAKREFAGYWEYVLDEALFIAPAHPQWGGAALIGAEGKLLGIGS